MAAETPRGLPKAGFDAPGGAAPPAGGGPPSETETTSGSAGRGVGPPISGLIAELTSLAVGMGFVAALAVVAAVLSLILGRVPKTVSAPS